jgi:hypothetical protein
MSRNFEKGPAFLEKSRAHSLWWEECLNTRSSNRKTVSITCFEGALQTTDRLSLITPSNPPPCLKIFFCAFKVTLGLVRSYVTFAITSSLTRGFVCLLWTSFAFVKCTYSTYSMLLKILPCTLYISPLAFQALQSISYLSYVSHATTAA